LAEKLIPYTRTEEARQVSAAKDAMSKLMLSFGGDRFGRKVPRETKASVVQAPTDLSKAQVAAQLKAFLMHQELEVIMQKATWESEVGWIRPTGEFTDHQKFSYVFWESMYPYFPKRTVVATKRNPIKLNVVTSRPYNTVLEITFTPQMFCFASGIDDNTTRLAVLRDLSDFRIEATTVTSDATTVLYALDELVSGPSATNQSATVRRRGEESQILHPDDYELSTNSQGLLARKRAKPPSISSLRITVQKTLDIGVKAEPSFVYKGDSVSLDAPANKRARGKF
jgi:hypothetical protein